MKRFIISNFGEQTLKDAEKKVNNMWINGDNRITLKTKLYEIKEVYDIKLKFVARKKKI